MLYAISSAIFSPSFMKMCDIGHRREWARDSLLTQNFWSYLAFYYYDCFYGWSVGARTSQFIINISRKWYFTLCTIMRLCSLSFSLRFNVCCETCLTSHSSTLFRPFIWSKNESNAHSNHKNNQCVHSAHWSGLRSKLYPIFSYKIISKPRIYYFNLRF